MWAAYVAAYADIRDVTPVQITALRRNRFGGDVGRCKAAIAADCGCVVPCGAVVVLKEVIQKNLNYVERTET